MVVLGAGVFANFITGLLFFALLVGFFQLAYTPAGYNFNVYATSSIQSQFLEDLNYSSTNLSSIELNNTTLFFNENNFQVTNLGVLKSINGQNINSYQEMRSALSNKSIDEPVLVEIEMNKQTKLYSFNLFAHPTRKGEVSLGLGNVVPPRTTIKEKIIGLFANYKDPTIHYQENFSSAEFFYNLLWWIMIINFLVALFNMLPLGILDGGQFYQLAILSVVKSEKISEKIILWTKKLIAFAFFLMMFFWLKNLIF
jgi:hypothetical protein